MTGETMIELPIADEGDFLCVRCARRRKTCCQTCEIYCTPGDVERIEAYTGSADFHEFRRPDDPVYLDQDDDPLWAAHVFRADESRRVLKRKPDGDCMFLGHAGCSLPYETRPIVCRLYPFDYNAEGIRDELCNGCPTELLPEGVGLVQALDMKRTDAERWHRMLYDELQREPKRELPLHFQSHSCD
jgi:Fe-S-cluster containining protein